MLHIGNQSYVKISEIETISPPESAPIKRMINEAKDRGCCIDLTYGRRTKSVIELRSGRIVLSAISTTTLVQKLQR